MKYLWQFTHDDLDGGGCAVIAAHVFPEHKRSVKYCHYNGPKSIDTVLMTFLDNHQPQEGEEHTLLITDILPSESVCEVIDHHLGEFAKVTAYDHHDTTSWAKGKYPWVFHGEACGTRLLYESTQTTSDKMHSFVYAVDAWDRWMFGSRYRERGELLSLVYKEIGAVEFVKAFTANLAADSDGWLQQLGTHLRRKRDLGIQQGLLHLDKNGFFFTDTLGKKAVVLFAYPDSDIGMFSDAILKARADIDYLAFLLPAANSVSLRCRKGSSTHVGNLAKTFPGGGGHQSAAGFPFPMRDGLFEALRRHIGSQVEK